MSAFTTNILAMNFIDVKNGNRPVPFSSFFFVISKQANTWELVVLGPGGGWLECLFGWDNDSLSIITA